MAESRYIHEEFTHDLGSPREIVPFLMNIFKPSSVVDVGCGIGTFLYCFKECGVKEVLGIDGSWADKNLVAKYLGPGEFLEQDLSREITVDRQFDMAICLEVGEHLANADAQVLVNSLTRLSKIIIFSAAIPQQGGQNHINEQWSGYWREKFSKHDYHFVDLLRPRFWENQKIHWWYRQNMFLVKHKSIPDNQLMMSRPDETKILDLVHPGLLKTKQDELDKIKNGDLALKSYLKMMYRKLFR